MKLADLIRRVRSAANDMVQPYLWSDDDIADWLTDAEAEAALRGRLLHESANVAVCRIPVVIGQTHYLLHAALYEITRLVFRASGELSTTPIKLVSQEMLDATQPDWRDSQGDPQYAVQSDTGLRLSPTPTRTGSLELEGFRLPLRPMLAAQQASTEPEIHAGHHIQLVQWALFRGYSRPDDESQDVKKAMQAEAEFTNYFGLRPDVDLRRSTRVDEVQHVAPFFAM